MTLAGIKNIKRLVIYFFFDREGIVDDYIPVILKDIYNNVSELFIVVNGEIDNTGINKFRTLTQNILIKENKGFDVGGYKAVFDWYGWQELKKFDEIILMNFTIMGPIYPFKEMFNIMDKKDIDFWGITLFHGSSFDPFGKTKCGYLPLHLQSHFIAVRNDMLTNGDFQLYWETMPEITSYEESICLHEAIFTKKFEELGFRWDVYVDTRDLMDYCDYPLLDLPLKLVKDKRCPVIKRRSFFQNYDHYLGKTNGEASIDLLDYIREKKLYDVNLIFDNILRLQNQADIKRCLHFNYILSSNVKQNNNLILKGKKIALIMHIFYEDLIDYCYQYAKSMPEESHIYITTDTLKKKDRIETVFLKSNWNKLGVIIVENKGRDISALLIGTKDFIMNYDYVCFAHDKKVVQLDMKIKGESFSYKCFENILKNSVFVENVLDTFEKNPRLGLLVPPPPNFADFYFIISNFDWSLNFKNTEALGKKLGLKVNFDNEKEPIAPLGTMFWFRPGAMKTLFDTNWKYEDFPEEPNDVDGTILHAIERLYPFIVQHEGYYPGWLMVDTFARIEITNLYYMLKELNSVAFSIYGINTHRDLLKKMKADHEKNNKSIKKYIKAVLKKILPGHIYKVLKSKYKFIKKLFMGSFYTLLVFCFLIVLFM